MKILSWLFIFAGIIFFVLGSYQIWLKEDPNRLAFKNYNQVATSEANKKDMPIRITIKKAKIDLPIFPAEIKNNTWPTTSDGASYLLSSPPPGQEGNSVIYAHNWASLFGNLVSISKGQEVEVTFADKSVKKFIIIDAKTVSPDESSILASSTDHRLTLYTCTGFFDSKRFVAIAKLQ